MQLALPCPLHGICSTLAPAPLPSDAWGFTAPSGNSDCEHLQSYYYYLLFAQWYLLIGSTARWVLLCYVQVKKTPCCGFQVCWRNLAESVLPISIAQSNTHIPRLRQESHCSLSRSPTPGMQRRQCSALSIYTAHSASSPCRVVSSQKCPLSTLFSHLSGISHFNSAECAKTCRRSFEMRCNSFSVFSLEFKSCPPPPQSFFFFFFLFSQELHFSQEDRRSWQRCDLMTSWGSKLRLARACCCLLLCFGWLQNWVEDQAEYLMIH